MKLPRIVLDTSIWIAALRSQNGASNKLLMSIDTNRFELCISVPLIVEYEAVAKRLITDTQLKEQDIDDILDYICKIATQQKISYLWRPYLSDPDDDMVLELAVNASCDFIITFNTRHFQRLDQFGIQVLTPQEFMKVIRI